MKHDESAARKTGRPLSFDRDQALEKAMLTFWRHGYETSSISELTAAMGISAPSLYSAFGDKKRLFLEAMRLYAGSPYDMDRAISEAPTASEAAERMMTAAAEAFTGELTPRGCLLASATASGSDASAEVQHQVAQVRSEIKQRVKDRIDKDVSEGLLPSETDSGSLAGLVIAVIQGLSVLARDGADRSQLLAIARAATNCWPAPLPASAGANPRQRSE